VFFIVLQLIYQLNLQSKVSKNDVSPQDIHGSVWPTVKIATATATAPEPELAAATLKPVQNLLMAQKHQVEEEEGRPDPRRNTNN